MGNSSRAGMNGMGSFQNMAQNPGLAGGFAGSQGGQRDFGQNQQSMNFTQAPIAAPMQAAAPEVAPVAQAGGGGGGKQGRGNRKMGPVARLRQMQKAGTAPMKKKQMGGMGGF